MRLKLKLQNPTEYNPTRTRPTVPTTPTPTPPTSTTRDQPKDAKLSAENLQEKTTRFAWPPPTKSSTTSPRATTSTSTTSSTTPSCPSNASYSQDSEIDRKATFPHVPAFPRQSSRVKLLKKTFEKNEIHRPSSPVTNSKTLGGKTIKPMGYSLTENLELDFSVTKSQGIMIGGKPAFLEKATNGGERREIVD